MSACPVCANPEATETSPDDVVCPACGLLVRRRCCASWMPRRHEPTCRVLRPSPATRLTSALAAVRQIGLLTAEEAAPLVHELVVAQTCPGDVLAVAVTAAWSCEQAVERMAEGLTGDDTVQVDYLAAWQESRCLVVPAVEQLRAAQHRRDHAGRAEA